MQTFVSLAVAIDVVHGVTTKILNESTINEMMVNKTIKCKILVADHRKIGLTSKFKIADISVFDYLITDKFCSEKVLGDQKYGDKNHSSRFILRTRT